MVMPWFVEHEVRNSSILVPAVQLLLKPVGLNRVTFRAVVFHNQSLKLAQLTPALQSLFRVLKNCRLHKQR